MKNEVADLVVANISPRCAKKNCVVVSIVQVHYERFQGCRFIHPNIWPSTQGDGDRVSDLAIFSIGNIQAMLGLNLGFKPV